MRETCTLVRLLSFLLVLTSTGASAGTWKSFTFGGHVYAHNGEQRTWHSASLSCQYIGYHLVTFSDIHEYSTVLDNVEYTDFWIGLSDEAIEGEWRWITGEQLDVEFWGSEEPNNAYRGEHWVHVHRYGNLAYWNDISNQVLIPYVCESY